MLDLLVRRATLPDGRTDHDIAIQDGRIVSVTPAISAPAARVIDAEGHLVTPPFVDAHFHIDSALLLADRQHVNHSGTLLEGIALWGRLKPDLTAEAIAHRALAWCDQAIARGLLAIRSHVDVSDPTLTAARALVEVKRQVAPHLDLQLVAFPQDGLLRPGPGGLDRIRAALDLGVDVIGGIPHFERTTEDGAASVRQLCELAAARGVPVDLHCDETDDPASRHIETLAFEARRCGLEGRVTASHVTSMHGMDPAYLAKLIPLIAESGVAVVANPLINITLQGRFDRGPVRRGMTRVAELRAAGVPVAFGHDCVQDPWYPLGTGDMLEVAHMGLHVGHLTSVEAMRGCFDAVTTTAARVIGLPGYGLQPGCHADLVVLQAADPIDALRRRAHRLVVVRRGRIVAESTPIVTRLHVPGRPAHIS